MALGGLAPKEHHIGDARHLKKELTVPTLMQQCSLWWPFHRKPAQHKRSRREAEMLVRILTPGANQFNDLHTFPGLSRNGKAEIRLLQYLASALKSGLNGVV
ncbi:MAG TPA: hypothetical protein VFM77_12460 [Terriglobales bacterium]|nr:hypothetical protein [Terriglobales bacterium]